MKIMINKNSIMQIYSLGIMELHEGKVKIALGQGKFERMHV